MAIKKLKTDFIALRTGELIDSITPLANGNLVVTSHTVSAAGAVKYFDRLYSSTYALLAGPTAGDVTAYATPPTVPRSTASDGGDGTYWMQWAAPADATHAAVHLSGQHFAVDGTKIGGEIDLSGLGSAITSGFVDSIVPTGDSAAPLAFTNITRSATTTLSLGFYSADLATQVGGITLADSVDNGAQFIGAVSQGSGKVLVSWMEKPAGGNFAIKTALVDTSGYIDVQSNASHGVLDAQVDGLPNGGYVLTCRETGTAGEKFQIKAYFYDASGILTGTAKDITISEPVFGKDYETVVLADGRVGVMWVTSDHHNADKTVLFLQYFDDKGYALTDEILLGYVPRQSSGINLHAELNSAGKLAVNWIGLDAGIVTRHSVVFDPMKFVPTDNFDKWYGTDANETFHGLGGNDIIGGGGNDTLYGDAGDDWLEGGAGADKLIGGAGFNSASYFLDGAVKVSLANPSTATGAAAGDTYFNIEGLVGSDKGNDTLWGNNKNNTLWGASGSDFLDGRGGDDFLNGGDGGDYLRGGAGSDTATYSDDKAVHASLQNNFGNTGAAKGDDYLDIENLAGSVYADFLTGDANDNRLYGDAGNDTLNGLDGNDYLEGQNGSDILNGGSGDDTFDGGAGNDRLSGGSGDDDLYGGAGRDVLSGGIGQDKADYFGSRGVHVSLAGLFAATGDAKGDTFNSIEDVHGSYQGNDKLGGNNHANVLFGEAGNDILLGMGGDDDLVGGDGKDVLDGGAGEDNADYYDGKGVTVALDGSLKGTGIAAGDTFISIEDLSGSKKYADILVGNDQKNYIRGHGGNDTLQGQGGVDGLNGGAGADRLDGGAGKDYYVYYGTDEGHDKIVNFEKGEYFSFSSNAFYGSAGYLLSDAEFQSGTTNQVQVSGSVHYVFRTSDCTLWYDADGFGGTASILIADMQNTYTLKAADIYVF